MQVIFGKNGLFTRWEHEGSVFGPVDMAVDGNRLHIYMYSFISGDSQFMEPLFDQQN